jgi:hypothetical protein
MKNKRNPWENPVYKSSDLGGEVTQARIIK